MYVHFIDAVDISIYGEWMVHDVYSDRVCELCEEGHTTGGTSEE